LGNSIVGSAKERISYVESHFLSDLFYVFELLRCQELANILHYKSTRSGEPNDLHIRPPKLLPWITNAILVEQAEALARGTTNYEVSTRNGIG
jgi:hypothetical protein